MPLSDNRLNQINCIKIIIILSRLVLSSKFWLIGELKLKDILCQFALRLVLFKHQLFT
jgi:hypothetical protein